MVPSRPGFNQSVGLFKIHTACSPGTVAMTDFLVTSLQDGTLTLLMLSTFEPAKRRHSTSSNEESQPLLPSQPTSTDRHLLQAFHNLHHILLNAFHGHWKYLTRPEADEKPTVMAFERVFKSWKLETVKWLSRGRVAGWWDDRGFLQLDRTPEGQPKS